jgi:hyperosmotically inducible periplasmic protein
MTFLAPRIEARFPPSQNRHRGSSRLSERDAAPGCIGPIHESDESHTVVSVEDHTRSSAPPTVAGPHPDYDECKAGLTASIVKVRKGFPMNATSLRVTLLATAAAAAAALLLSACQREAGDATVGQRLDKAIDRTQEKLAEAGDKTQVAVANAADKVVQKTDQAVAAVQDAAVPIGNGAADAGKGLSDAAITASIKTDLLKDPDLSVLKIDVDTQGGIVTLNGLTGDEAGRSRAGRLANSIKGVKEVRNFLVVKHA